MDCAGAVFTGVERVPDRTDEPCPERRAVKIDRVIEVNMNTMAAKVVAASKSPGSQERP